MLSYNNFVKNQINKCGAKIKFSLSKNRSVTCKKGHLILSRGIDRSF